MKRVTTPDGLIKVMGMAKRIIPISTTYKIYRDSLVIIHHSVNHHDLKVVETLPNGDRIAQGPECRREVYSAASPTYKYVTTDFKVTDYDRVEWHNTKGE